MESREAPDVNPARASRAPAGRITTSPRRSVAAALGHKLVAEKPRALAGGAAGAAGAGPAVAAIARRASGEQVMVVGRAAADAERVRVGLANLGSVGAAGCETKSGLSGHRFTSG